MKRQSKKIKRKSPTKNIRKKDIKVIGGGFETIDIDKMSDEQYSDFMQKFKQDNGYHANVPKQDYEQKFIKSFIMTRDNAYSIFKQHPNTKIYIVRNKKIDDTVLNNRNMFLNTEAVLSYPKFNNGSLVGYSDELVTDNSLRLKIKYLRENGYKNVEELGY